MGVIATNLIQGPGTLYHAIFGSTEPADTSVALAAAPSAPFADVGGTSDGVTIAFNQEFSTLAVDQITETVGRRKTSSEFVISTNLAEPTLENLARTLNQLAATVVSGTGTKKLEPVQGNSATQPNYSALIFDGWAPDSKKRRVTGRKMLSTGNTEAAYTKDSQTVFAVSWNGHYVSESIKSWSVLDEVAA